MQKLNLSGSFTPWYSYCCLSKRVLIGLSDQKKISLKYRSKSPWARWVNRQGDLSYGIIGNIIVILINMSILQVLGWLYLFFYSCYSAGSIWFDLQEESHPADIVLNFILSILLCSGSIFYLLHLHSSWIIYIWQNIFLLLVIIEFYLFITDISWLLKQESKTMIIGSAIGALVLDIPCFLMNYKLALIHLTF